MVESIFASLYIIDPGEAFALAIAQGRLSEDPAAGNYAGNYMYMSSKMVKTWWGKEYRRDDFKHHQFRDYLPDAKGGR